MVSLLAGGSSALINGATEPLSALLGSSTATTDMAFVFGMGTAAQTLEAGGAAIAVSGTVMSLLPGGSSVVVGGQTVAASVLVGEGARSTVLTGSVIAGLGGIIASLGGFGGIETAGSASRTSSGIASLTGAATFNGTMFSGRAARRLEIGLGIWANGLIGGMFIINIILL